MKFSEYVFLFAGMGFVTYVPRWLPLLCLTHRRLPQWLIDWLRLIPAAVLSALLAPSLFTDAAPRAFHPGRAELLVAVPTFLFAVKTGSLGGTVLFGMILYWLAGMVL